MSNKELMQKMFEDFIELAQQSFGELDSSFFKYSAQECFDSVWDSSLSKISDEDYDKYFAAQNVSMTIAKCVQDYIELRVTPAGEYLKMLQELGEIPEEEVTIQ